MQHLATIRRLYGDTQIDYRTLSGQVIAEVRGVVSAKVLGDFVLDMLPIVAQTQALSMVVELRQADVTATLSEICANPSRVPQGMSHLPICTVVRNDAWSLFRGHAWAAAKAGLIRGVFVDQEEARQWAHRHQPNHLIRLCSQTPESAR